MAPGSSTCYVTRLSCNNLSKSLMVYPGIDVEEIREIIKTAFDTKGEVMGLKDKNQGVHFPLSLLSHAPAYFSSDPSNSSSYEVVVLGEEDSHGPMEKFDLSSYALSDLLDIFSSAAPTGALDRTTFQKCFEKITGSKSDPNGRAKSVFNRLFDIFDRDGNGVVDSVEFLSGLSVLSSGDRDHKIKTAFDLYDTNGDGFISLDEMTKYLTSVFSVIAETSPHIFQHHKVGPAELGAITAQQCFAEADLNHDGRLSFHEFREWYTKPGNQAICAANENPEDSTDPIANAPPAPVMADLSMEQIKEYTGIAEFSAEQIFSIFSSNSTSGSLTRKDFARSFQQIMNMINKPITVATAEVIDRLFDILDKDKNGTVDFNELASGLSILCGGTQEEKVRSAFRLFDVDGDGFISLTEMEVYLTSVFRVLFEASSMASNFQINPEELARITSKQAFLEADTNKDGRLSFEEFQKWYSQPTVINPPESTNPSMNLDTIRKLTKLESRNSKEVFELFASCVNEDGVLTRTSFNKCFRELLSPYASNISELDKQNTKQIIDQLFDMFDTDGNGTVDFVELSSGLTILCNGSQEDKVASAFALYDLNGDGFISLEEMISYLTSVFRVLYITDASKSIDIPCEQLAMITAQQAFMDADVNKDGKLSFEEFSKWYKESSNFSLGSSSDPSNLIALPSAALKEARELTNLQSYNVNDIFKFFRASADSNGCLSKQKFFRCFNKLILKTGGQDRSHQERTKVILNKLFTIFDTDKNGVVDIQELGAGLSLLCGGKAEDKVAAAFSLFDENEDGFISKEEMKAYLTSVFRVLYESSPEIRESMGVSSVQLAVETMEECFKNCDLNNDGKLSLKEFKLWYTNPQQKNIQEVIDQPTMTLAEAREFTGLSNTKVEDVFQMFAEAADDSGAISRSAFDKCFHNLILRSGNTYPSARAKYIVNRLFTIFDTDGNGTVDFSELASGLSVLATGTRDSKVENAFSLYDFNGDGYISLNEMITYLTSVFKILFETNLEAQKSVGISANDLAVVTAQQAFKEADLDNDGRLSFEEFQRWYSQPKQDSFNRIVGPVDLAEVRRLTNLGSIEVDEVFEKFASYADSNGLLSRSAFNSCFRKIVQAAALNFTEADKQRVKIVINRLFEIFDRDSNGSVDFSELASGLSVLCKGPRYTKVKAAFALYDHNNDGYISLQEMATYLVSVFRVLYEIQPEMARSTGVSADELGIVTAEQAFEEADLDKDGRLSYDEFEKWYQKPTHRDLKSMVVNTATSWMTLEEVKRLTNLQHHAAEDIFELFAEYSDESGFLTRSAFNSCFRKLISESVSSMSIEDQERTKVVIDRLFDVFDEDGNGIVDFSELSSGLSVLCGGSREDKVRAAFTLFDFNCDGYISLDEMKKYLSSVFRVLYEISPSDEKQMGIDPDELAAITAEQAFVEADLDHDGRLSLEEFQRWYSQSGGFEINENILNKSERYFSLQEARRLTNLEAHTPQEVFEMLAERVNEEGYVTKPAFRDCFRQLVQARGDLSEVESSRLNTILDRLFEVFDSDGNGVVDFSEISGGLSVLCGGNRDEKVKAAFSLYDFNGDGYISLPEMKRYLISVFKVLNETNPKALANLDVSPEELGDITAEQAFTEADLNKDGRLSMEEFSQWYSKSSTAQNLNTVAYQSIPDWFSIQEIRRITNLESYTPEEVFEVLACAADEDGVLNNASFNRCFRDFISKTVDISDEDSDRLSLVLDRLFTIFDSDKNGIVDFSELSSGLSVLCGGSRDQKVRSAFSLYDYNGDGFISLEEMTRYLVSIFRVLYETSPDIRDRMGVSPDDLGRVTAEQAFSEADLDKDGKLSFDEFRKWYAEPSHTMLENVVATSIPRDISFNMVREVTHLDKYDTETVINEFKNCCDDNGNLTREMFLECFEKFIPNDKDVDMDRVHVVLNRLFDIFDHDHNGFVDFSELSSGISILCCGSREEKIKAAFSLYDLNGDGYISLDEMTRYLSSIFRILYETTPGTEKRIGVNADELASVTAEQCFEEADVNKDGRISYDEFVRWYSTSSLAPGFVAPDTSDTLEDSFDGQPLTNMDRVRNLLKLDTLEVNDVFEIFAEAAPSGELSYSSLKKCFDHIIQLGGGHDTTAEMNEASVIISRLFRIFDTDGNNSVDFGELASGLSVLSGSSMDDKVLAAFQLYDINGDGYISMEEMINYMTSIFKVMYETSDNAQDKVGVGPEELARVTATQCFNEADINNDGKLSFAEFKKWCIGGFPSSV